MISRRRLLGAATIAAGAAATGGLAHVLTPTIALQPSPVLCLDMEAARAIVSGTSPFLTSEFEKPWLDLADFLTYELDALKYLVANIGELELASFGFRRLTLEGARTLAQIPVSYFILGDLATLDEQVASVIGGWNRASRPIRCLNVQTPLSVEVARALMAGAIPLTEETCDTPIDLSLPSISVDVAGVLRHQTHEFYIRIRDEPLSAEVAAELAQHTGYSLWLYLARGLSAEAMAALSSNPAKRIALAPVDEPPCVHLELESINWFA